MCESVVKINLNDEEVEIDKCISDFVKILNDNGIETEFSCCGHEIRPSTITLKDKRKIYIANKYQAKLIDEMFPPSMIYVDYIKNPNCKRIGPCYAERIVAFKTVDDETNSRIISCDYRQLNGIKIVNCPYYEGYKAKPSFKDWRDGNGSIEVICGKEQ